MPGQCCAAQVLKENRHLSDRFYVTLSLVAVPWVPDVFSRATRSFVVFGGRSKTRTANSPGHFEDSKPETAHEKPLAPRVE